MNVGKTTAGGLIGVVGPCSTQEDAGTGLGGEKSWWGGNKCSASPLERAPEKYAGYGGLIEDSQCCCRGGDAGVRTVGGLLM